MTNRLGATCWMVVCCAAWVVSCSGKDNHGGFVVPDDSGGAGGSVTHPRAGAGGGSSSAGEGPRGGAGGNGGMADSALAPEIKITAPKPAADPNADEVLTDDQVTVVCQVERSTTSGAAAVDASTVKIAMLDADGKELKSASGTPTENDNEYSAAFVTVPVPSGPVTFQCTASDTAKHTASDSIDSLIDHGPEIDIIEPEKASAHNGLAPMAVEFDTAPVPLTKGDKQADVSGVSLTVYGVDVKTTDAGGGKYKATVNFTDKVFGAIPIGPVPVVLTASNKRKAPGKATHSISYSILVDGTPPTIAVVSPAPQAVVGRASVLKFTAVDSGAGIDNSTVTVKLNETPYVFSPTNGKWSVETSGLFTFQLGAEVKNERGDTQVTVNISAKDKAGNAGNGAAIFNLDNQPPIVDMDPPNLYEVTSNSNGTAKQCSDYFDPLGTDAPNDLQTLSNYARFRALVYDATNTKAGQSDFFFALTDRNSVQIFLQYDKNSPLLQDEDGDGVCDEIWTGTAPHQKKPTDKPIPFDGLKPAAVNSFRGTVSYPDPKIDSPLDEPCTGGVASTAPHLCKDNSSDMSVVIHHGVGKTEPIIYSIDPIDSNDAVSCTGQEWQVSTAISEVNGGQPYLGWICVAARAVDNVGNAGISAPLRICLDDGTNSHRCDNDPPPKCTDNCTAPKHFNQIVKHD